MELLAQRNLTPHQSFKLLAFINIINITLTKSMETYKCLTHSSSSIALSLSLYGFEGSRILIIIYEGRFCYCL